MMRVRFPLPAPVNGVTGCSWRPGVVRAGVRAHIAQSVEHFLGKEEVTGSSPVMSSSKWAGQHGINVIVGLLLFVQEVIE